MSVSVNTLYDVPAAVPPNEDVSESELAAHAAGTEVVVVVEELGNEVDVVVVVVEWL
jgi:hypothetical protein